MELAAQISGICLLMLLVAAGVDLGRAARRQHAKVKRIKDTPISAIGGITDGNRKIIGQITERHETVTAPLTGTRCVYYDFTVWERVGRNEGRDVHDVIIRDTKIVDCCVDDGTGAAIVDLEGVELVIDTDHHKTSGPFNAASHQLEAILEKYNKTSKGWVLNKKLHYVESLLEIGDELYVLGPATVTEGDIYFQSVREQPLIVSDYRESYVLDYFARKRRNYDLSIVAVVLFAVLVVYSAVD